MHVVLSIFRLFWVACCAVALLAQTRLLLGIPLQPEWTDGFVFGGTVFGYHWTHPDKRYRLLAWVAGLLGGICFLITLFDDLQEIWGHCISLAPILFWLAYYGFQKPGNAGLRSMFIAKPLTVALTWAWVTVLLPTPPLLWLDLRFMLLGRAAFIFALTLAYDLCDESYDRMQGLNTLTLRLGFEKSFTLIYSSLLVAGLCTGVNIIYHYYSFHQALVLSTSLLISAFWLRFVLKKPAWEAWQKPLIDALMLLQFFLVWLLTC